MANFPDDIPAVTPSASTMHAGTLDDMDGAGLDHSALLERLILDINGLATSAGSTITRRVTFSNADDTVAATTKCQAQVGTMSAPRTLTLPSRAAVNDGDQIVVLDESGSVTSANYLDIVVDGSDTIKNPAGRGTTASVRMTEGFGVRVLRAVSTASWQVMNLGTGRQPYYFLSHARDYVIPTNVWTPLPWGANYADTDGVYATNASTTTIAAGSDAVALPTGTINVASTTGFATAGYITIEGPHAASTDTIVQYTGIGATTFTGCTRGTGTLATGQNVRPAHETITFKTAGLYGAICALTWVCHATGARNMRVKQGAYVLGIDTRNGIAADTTAALATNDLEYQAQFMASEPRASVGDTAVYEVWQNSGGPLVVKQSGFESPVTYGSYRSAL